MKVCVVCKRELEPVEFKYSSSIACRECQTEKDKNRKWERLNRTAYLREVQKDGRCAICGKSTDARLYFLTTKSVYNTRWQTVEKIPLVHLDCLIQIQPKSVFKQAPSQDKT